MRLSQCHNYHDFRSLAKRRLPGPIFNYIDGAADDEVTYRRNTTCFDNCDLVPNVLAGVEDVDISVTVMGQKLDMPFYLSPTALQRLSHHRGERAVAAAAEKYGTMFGVEVVPAVQVTAWHSGPCGLCLAPLGSPGARSLPSGLTRGMSVTLSETTSEARRPAP